MDYSKYEHVIDMLENQCPENNTDRSTMEAFWDEVFTYIHANFVPPGGMDDPEFKGQLAACNELLNNRVDAHENIKKIPPVLLEAVFPIAVASYFFHMKTVTKCNQAWINHRSLKTLEEFYDRYGVIILNAR